MVHFRKKNTPLCLYDFSLGGAGLKTVSEYKYPGILLNEYLDYNLSVQTLVDAAKRALGAIINKLTGRLLAWLVMQSN